ncbi:MAG: trigger factor [Psychroflexus sp.]|nr:trigger factor [Psychroflexus sp.]
MNTTKEQVDDLNAIIKIQLNQEDYQPKVDKTLKEYRKKANVPGFRKGKVPMGMLRKQYGESIRADEVNKMINEELQRYIQDEKLELIGGPIPIEDEKMAWDKSPLEFKFEVGMFPKVEPNLTPDDQLDVYKIVADEDMINEQIQMIQKQFGKMESREEIDENSTIVANIKSSDEKVDKESTFTLDQVNEDQQDTFKGAKVGDVLNIDAQGFLKNENTAQSILGIDNEEFKSTEGDLTIEIIEINETIPAELNQDLFDKYLGEGKVSSEEEFRNHIQEQIENQFKQQADQKFFNDATEFLIDNTPFELPENFLKKWLKFSSDKNISQEEADKEFEDNKKGIKYQLIEGKIKEEHDIKVTEEDLKQTAKDALKAQMAQYGQGDLADEQIEQLSQTLLQQEEQKKQMEDQALSKKLLDFFKEKLPLNEKEVTYKAFIDLAYGKPEDKEETEEKQAETNSASQ